MTHFLLGTAFIGHVKAEIRIVMKKFVLLILFVVLPIIEIASQTGKTLKLDSLSSILEKNYDGIKLKGKLEGMRIDNLFDIYIFVNIMI